MFKNASIDRVYQVFLGISSEYTDGIPRKFRGNSEETEFRVSSEYPRKFLGKFRGFHFPSECSSEYRCFLVSKRYGPSPSHLELVDEDDDVEEELGEGVGYEKDLEYEEHDSESE
ncbi:hypothetical protein F2Q69_00002195 [Brassica cretica]|uniref:Uncharacterized protein n=1 Tax=Brassica cretica TaxID=69181 RepID=A0A8S9PNJ4_BRACR|nr:hypothetical protein F2Q69_00002195 [Brassica cretica]